MRTAPSMACRADGDAVMLAFVGAGFQKRLVWPETWQRELRVNLPGHR